MTDLQILYVAQACHEANRAWCLAHGDASQVPWDDAPEHIKGSAIAGIRTALTATPAEQHEQWCRFKIEAGWTYGATKDADRRTHPCLVPYSDLPDSQKAKDAIYIAVVRAFAAAFGDAE